MKKNTIFYLVCTFVLIVCVFTSGCIYGSDSDVDMMDLSKMIGESIVGPDSERGIHEQTKTPYISPTQPQSNKVSNTPSAITPAKTNQNVISVLDMTDSSKSVSVDVSNKNTATLYSKSVRFRDLTADTGLPSNKENMDTYRIRIENPIPIITITVDYDYEMTTYTKTVTDKETGEKKKVTNTIPETSQYAEILVYDSSGRVIKDEGFSGGLYGGYSASSSRDKISILTRDSYYDVVLRGDGMGAKITITYG